MRLTKYFAPVKNIERSINSWVREKPKLRVILQMMPYNDGIMVLYEKATFKDEWASIKRGYAKKPRKVPTVV